VFTLCVTACASHSCCSSSKFWCNWVTLFVDWRLWNHLCRGRLCDYCWCVHLVVCSVGVVAGHRLCISCWCWFLVFVSLYAPPINGVASPYSLLDNHADPSILNSRCISWFVLHERVVADSLKVLEREIVCVVGMVDDCEEGKAN
jgi:hypothetical protein